MVTDYLRKNGPCLSSELAEKLVLKYRISPEAARKRISRAGSEVRRLDHLPFPKKVRFVYLQEQYASNWYWARLFQAIEDTGGVYARALAAVLGRTAVPIEHFKIACGSPIAQKKHIAANLVLERMIAADVLVKEFIPSIGDCVITKQQYDENRINGDETFLNVRSRLAAESILIESVKEWLKRLAFASFNKVKTRFDLETPPMVGTFAWDLTAPSYIAGLTSWQDGDIKSGFVVCDFLLEKKVSLKTIDPFLHKVSSTQSLRNVGHTMFIFVAHSYSDEAFSALRAAGVVPATTRSLFGIDVADGFVSLVNTFTEAINGNLDLDNFNDVFERLGKLEGCMGNMRGDFFELLVAELIRKKSSNVELNRVIKASSGNAEVDVFVIKNGVEALMIECKGMAPGVLVDNDEIALWLTTRIVRVKEYIFDRLEWRANWPKPRFELWTCGVLSEESLERIERTRVANNKKIEIAVVGTEDIYRKLKEVNDPALLKSFGYFLPKKKFIKRPSRK